MCLGEGVGIKDRREVGRGSKEETLNQEKQETNLRDKTELEGLVQGNIPLKGIFVSGL